MTDFQQKDGQGALFKNERKTKDTHPDYQGSFTLSGKRYSLAGWIKKGKKGSYMSLSVQDWKNKEERPAKTDADEFVDDSIPF